MCLSNQIQFSASKFNFYVKIEDISAGLMVQIKEQDNKLK